MTLDSWEERQSHKSVTWNPTDDPELKLKWDTPVERQLEALAMANNNLRKELRQQEELVHDMLQQHGANLSASEVSLEERRQCECCPCAECALESQTKDKAIAECETRLRAERLDHQLRFEKLKSQVNDLVWKVDELERGAQACKHTNALLVAFEEYAEQAESVIQCTREDLQAERRLRAFENELYEELVTHVELLASDVSALLSLDGSSQELRRNTHSIDSTRKGTNRNKLFTYVRKSKKCPVRGSGVLPPPVSSCNSFRQLDKYLSHLHRFHTMFSVKVGSSCCIPTSTTITNEPNPIFEGAKLPAIPSKLPVPPA